MKSLVELSTALLLDAGGRCSAPVAKDIDVLKRRALNEGDSFITITLPSLSQGLERALEQGRATPHLFPRFKCGRAGYPLFMGDFLCRVFGKDGVLLEHASVLHIEAIRQVCRFASKIDRPCTSARQRSAAEAYLRTESEIGVLPDSQLVRYVGRVGDILMDALALDDPSGLNDMVAKHGPGRVAWLSLLNNEKWTSRVWHRRLEEAGLSYQSLMWGSARHRVSDVEMPALTPRWDEPPVKVVHVPKTMKTTRVIAVEPLCMQFAQQALRQRLYSAIENCRLTRGHVNFRDQEVNQRLASQSSLDGRLATVDMSEASDRVSLAHFELVFRSSYSFRVMARACRSERARVPSGEEIYLKKFASMGSALCFPVEAMVFYSIILASRILRAGRFPTKGLVQQMLKEVYVYGDDLLFPSDEAQAICDDLESLGLRVNRHKSFWTGKFRESCGEDCYAGQRVTPVYLRHDCPLDRGDASEIVSIVATSNQLFSAGYTRCAALLRKSVEALLGPLPTVCRDGSSLGWTYHSEYVPPKRWNRYLQRFEYRCWVPVSLRSKDSLEGSFALAKVFRTIGSTTLADRGNPFNQVGASDPDHLVSSPRRYSLALKRTWGTIH